MQLFIAAAIVVLVFALYAALWFLGAALLMFAWNMFMPLVWASAPHLSYWAALGLTVLISIVKNILSPTVIKVKK